MSKGLCSFLKAASVANHQLQSTSTSPLCAKIDSPPHPDKSGIGSQPCGPGSQAGLIRCSYRGIINDTLAESGYSGLSHPPNRKAVVDKRASTHTIWSVAVFVMVASPRRLTLAGLAGLLGATCSGQYTSYVVAFLSPDGRHSQAPQTARCHLHNLGEISGCICSAGRGLLQKSIWLRV